MKKITLLIFGMVIFVLSTYCFAGTYTITTSDSDEATLQWALNKHNTQLSNIPTSLTNNKNFKAPTPIDEPTFINQIIRKEINRINVQMNNENSQNFSTKYNKATPTIKQQINNLLK